VDTASVAARFTRLQALIAVKGGDPPPPGPPLEAVVGFHFTFATPSPQIFGAIPAGVTFSSACVLIETPFDAPATLQLGSSADLGLLLDVNDSRLMIAGQYQSDALVIPDVADVLVFTLSSAGASVGEGYLFYRMLPT
jgi:hypothetical protein